MVPKDRLVVSESGIHTPEDVKKLQDGGIGAFLIGEAFMRQTDPGEALSRLVVR
jgi:indole-3-glycerol phosphate synthase